ncbi:MAG: TM0106 family RecB-like putative nuclease [Chloroflexota bacterium]
MQLIDGQPVYSATDLVGYVLCRLRTRQDRAVAHRLVEKPIREDDELDLITRRGLDHEQRYLATLRATPVPDGRGGRRAPVVAEVTRDGSGADQDAFLRAAAAETLDAMRSGADVIYQATFYVPPAAGRGGWRGHADFLHRVEVPSDALGGWSYCIADTKLARKPKAGAILQMAVYAEMLGSVQGVMPEWIEVALGGSAREVVRFRVADSAAYMRRVRARFLAEMEGSRPVWPVPDPYPEPVDHCSVCRWDARCATRRRQDDHLSLVAGISRSQREVLVAAGIDSVADLALLPIPITDPRALGIAKAQVPAMERVREQARLQVAVRPHGRERVLHERLPLEDPPLGLAHLPAPSPGDLFFDIEGDPWVDDGGADGLEYLFGVIEPGSTEHPDEFLRAGREPDFHAFWGTDRAGEKVAFEALIDLIVERRRQWPEMHVYHYAAYEPGAVKRLMSRHATRAAEVDTLLRAGVFVDLFRVVRHGIRVSTESYSIKKLEPLYGLTRTVPLKDAGSSVVRFEEWLDGGRKDASILDGIALYNQDDCLSNWRLRAWLEGRRAELERDLGRTIERPAPEDGAASEKAAEDAEAVARVRGSLLAGLPAALEERTAEEQATWLLAHLLEWHRREDRATWWTWFDLLDKTPEELLDDGTALAGLVPTGLVREEGRSHVITYRFPPQETKVRDGTPVKDPATGRAPGSVERVDHGAGIVELKRGKSNSAPDPTVLIPFELVGAPEQRAALLEIGAWVAEHGRAAPGPSRAGRDLLLRRAPAVGRPAGGALVEPGESELDAAIRLVTAMETGVLAIQGPPGSGKTYSGARMIVRLVEQGRRVGVTANAHKVIGNLLDAVAEAAAELGVPVRIGQKPGQDGGPTHAPALPLKANADVAAALAAGVVDVVGGTGWLWAHGDLRASVDVLVVDEAGQMSLANAVAVSAAAHSLVLLGDPRQLEQPVQGTHPTGAGASALEHLLGGARTMPPELGLFLEDTYRLHPEIARFTSELFYEDRLRAVPGLEGQRVHGEGPFAGAGLRFVEVVHRGNVDASPEEAEAVLRIVRALIGRPWTNEKGVTAPLGWADLRILAPYNAQVALLGRTLPAEAERQIGTVDRFQGQTAAVSIYTMTTSSPEEAPRGMEFLYSLNRLNVATSRARALAIVVADPSLLDPVCATPDQIRLANGLCAFAEMAERVRA